MADKPETTQPRPHERIDSPARARVEAQRRARVWRSAGALLFFILLFIIVILVRRDGLHKERALSSARSYIDTALAPRMGESGQMPLNLAPLPNQPGFTIHHLDRQQAVWARQHDSPVLVAWTASVDRSFAPTGRAVVIFSAGVPSVEWLGESEFDQRQRGQESALATYRGTPAPPTVP